MTEKNANTTNTTNSMNKNAIVAFAGFGLCMAVMGASDSLRGVFSLVFQNHFALTSTQVSMIVTVSYIGNLVFLLLGGRLLDRFPKKRVFLATLGVWMSGAAFFIVGDSYYLLLLGMFLCMGASTLLNTTVNIMVPILFAFSPGMIVNVLFFVQGIGTSGSQNILGRYASDLSSWKWVNILLWILAAAGMLLVALIRVPGTKGQGGNAAPEQDAAVKNGVHRQGAAQENGAQGQAAGRQITAKQQGGLREQISLQVILRNKAFWFFIVMFGFYFIAEHGIMNWYMMYAVKGLSLDNVSAANYLSIFFGGMTVGRLVFAPVVHKLGEQKSVFLFGTIGGILYVIGIAGGLSTAFLLSASGAVLSIIYPTMVLLIQKYYDQNCVATATGMIISIATLFDILFNMCFGKVTDLIGMKAGFYILLGSMILFVVTMLLFGKQKKD